MLQFNFVYTFWHVLYCLNKPNDDETLNRYKEN